MNMATLTDAIGAVASYLREMGYTAYSLKISSFDTTSAPGAWTVSGTFQNGFMSEYYRFEMIYEPETGSARKLVVEETPVHAA